MLVKKHYEVFETNPGGYGLIIKNSARLASKVNKLLNRYPDNARFTDQDEPVFFFNEQEKDRVGIVLGVKQWPTNQTLDYMRQNSSQGGTK